MSAPTAWLSILEGDRQGERVYLERFPFTLGRAPECDLVLELTGVSRLHARIERSFGQYRLVDAGSRNGTFVNGQRVEGERLLCSSDEIRLGALAVLRFEDPAATDQIDLRALSLDGIEIDQACKEVFVRGQVISPPLSPGQFALLELLVSREGELVPREDIAAAVWPGQAHITDQMIDTLVSRLRQRLAAYGADRYIVTRRGFGLIFLRRG